MDSIRSNHGNSGVKTRYSFYEAASLDLVKPEPKAIEPVPETRTMENEEIGSLTDIEKTAISNQQKGPTNSTRADAAQVPEVGEILRNLAETEERGLNRKTETRGNDGITSKSGKPPMHERGGSSINHGSNTVTNAHERAIREALGYIRKRGHQRALFLESSSNVTTDGEKWNNGQGEVTDVGCAPLPISIIDSGAGVDGSTALATATQLDNRLLSPPADVRKAASDMFRHHGDSDDSVDGKDVIKPFDGLELAKPVHSISNLSSGGSPMHATSKPTDGQTSDSTLPHFSITPSSPAPGKFQQLSNGQHSATNDTETPEMRRHKLELERRTRAELQIERGVEQVLMAILQKAETKTGAQGGDSIENILTTLFAEQSTSPEIGTTGKMRPTRLDSEDEDVDEMEAFEAHQISVAEELLAERSCEEDEVVLSNSQTEDDSSSTHIDTSIRPINRSEGMLEVEAIKSGTVEADYDDAGNSNHEVLVLGPLSTEMGGTTGVVLQNDDNDEPSEECEVTDVNEGQEEKDVPSSIISSVKSAARRTQKMVVAKLSFSSSSRSMEDDDVAKDLYSHIFVRYASQRAGKKESILAMRIADHFSGSPHSGPDLRWEDDDPDEPGYIVHTFSSEKLQEIEQKYEEFVEKFGSEFAVAMKEESLKAQRRPESDFERDLQEAENLLEKQTLKQKKGKGPQRKKAQEDSRNRASKNQQDSSLMTNPNFPGAKAAGTGEVGDLEIYHLPIIYKAHQTGFEPTKDLVLQPDSVFAGQYYVQSELGSAAFSTAYRCVDLNSGKKAEDGEIYYDEVCLKVIKNTKDFFDQSLDEIKILELLRQTGECSEHNILEMKSFFYHKEHLIIVTELLRQNLFEFGKYITEHDEPQYFTRSRLCYIARQCLVALSFVHKLGLVHSDIKPENILLSSYSRARVKVIDFGSSCYLSDRQSSYIQSRSYRAPEVVLGLPYDGKIDVWSLGCVIAEMYTGQVTFQNDSVVSMLARIEAICGAFPRHMIDGGRQSGQFFTPTGLLYEKIGSDDEDSALRMEASRSFRDDDSAENTFFHILQPKSTTMAERLGFDTNLMSAKRKTWEEDEKALFTDFVAKLLTVDPSKRPTADEALEHPWILSGFNLTEEDLKYPPEE